MPLPSTSSRRLWRRRNERQPGNRLDSGGQTSKKKYRMPRTQRPGSMVAGSSKRGASRFCQVKTVRCLTGQYLHWTKNRPTAQCWWCRYRTQTRDHLFKAWPGWKAQQKIPWAEMQRESGRRKSRCRIHHPGPPCRWEVQPVGPRLPLHHGCGKAHQPIQAHLRH